MVVWDPIFCILLFGVSARALSLSLSLFSDRCHYGSYEFGPTVAGTSELYHYTLVVEDSVDAANCVVASVDRLTGAVNITPIAATRHDAPIIATLYVENGWWKAPVETFSLAIDEVGLAVASRRRRTVAYTLDVECIVGKTCSFTPWLTARCSQFSIDQSFARMECYWGVMPSVGVEAQHTCDRTACLSSDSLFSGSCYHAVFNHTEGI
jgi:hypothetical protein